MATKPLAGLRVLICRPRDQAEPLSRALKEAGAETRILPTLEIHPLPLSAAQRSLVQNLDLYQVVIAVSANAARLFVEAADEWWPQWPTGITWLAVGQQTGAVLQAAGLPCEYPDQGMSSEDLLDLPVLASIEGQRILLCKGIGGREALSQSLQQRHARLDELELYERVIPDYEPGRIREALVDFDPQLIVALSGETLNNLCRLGQNTDRTLQERAVLVPGERVARLAIETGFGRILTPVELTPAAIVARMTAWHLDGE